MRQQIDEEVSVVMYYSSKLKQAVPHLLSWKNEDYKLLIADYQHSYKEGRKNIHIFEMVNVQQTLHFRLKLDTSNLHWTLETIHDGLAD